MLISPDGIRFLFFSDRLLMLEGVNIILAFVRQGLGRGLGYFLAEQVDPVFLTKSTSSRQIDPLFMPLSLDLMVAQIKWLNWRRVC
jgi:hypothetical protein